MRTFASRPTSRMSVTLAASTIVARSFRVTGSRWRAVWMKKRASRVNLGYFDYRSFDLEGMASDPDTLIVSRRRPRPLSGLATAEDYKWR